jgi:hypothetical protein
MKVTEYFLFVCIMPLIFLVHNTIRCYITGKRTPAQPLPTTYVCLLGKLVQFSKKYIMVASCNGLQGPTYGEDNAFYIPRCGQLCPIRSVQHFVYVNV